MSHGHFLALTAPRFLETSCSINVLDLEIQAALAEQGCQLLLQAPWMRRQRAEKTRPET